MTIDIYKSKEWSSITAVVEGETEMLEKDAVLIKKIKGADWNDCMAKYHEFMNWEPYRPFIP
jgi:hypothetical protein